MSAHFARDLSHTTVSAVQSWLASLTATEASMLVEALGAGDGRHEELGTLSDAIAVAPNGANWSLIITAEPNVDGAQTGQVTVIPAFGDPFDSNWATLRDDPKWWLRRDAQIVGDTVEPSDLPFMFDGDAWIGAEYDFIYGEGDCTISINGSPEQVRLDESIAYRQPIDHGGAANIVEIGCEGASMTSGGIGSSVHQDANGSCWSELWGCTRTFLGRPANEAKQHSMAWSALGESLNSVDRITSDVLSPQEIRDLLGSIPAFDPNFCPSSIEIVSPRFTGTAEELIALLPEVCD